MPVYAGWQLQVYIATGSSLGSFSGSSTGIVIVDGIQSIGYDYINNLEAKEETGQRTKKALVEGTVGITGTLERFVTGSGTLGFGFVNTSTGSALPVKGILICPNGFNSAGNPFELIAEVKFDSRRTNQRPGSALYTETLGFMALYVVTGSF